MFSRECTYLKFIEKPCSLHCFQWKVLNLCHQLQNICYEKSNLLFQLTVTLLRTIYHKLDNFFDNFLCQYNYNSFEFLLNIPISTPTDCWKFYWNINKPKFGNLYQLLFAVLLNCFFFANSTFVCHLIYDFEEKEIVSALSFIVRQSQQTKAPKLN